MVNVLRRSCQQAETETAGTPKWKKDLVLLISISTTAAPTCINSENVPYPHQSVLSYRQHRYFSDTKRTDMPALNDQKAEKGKVYLSFGDTFHYTVSLAKGGNLRLQKEKQGKKQDSSRGQQSPCLRLADPWSKVRHYHNRSPLWMAEAKILPGKTVLRHIKKCKSEACYGLNTESTLGTVWGSWFWGTKTPLCGSLAKAWFQLCSDPTAGFAFYQQRHPARSLLVARPFHSGEWD